MRVLVIITALIFGANTFAQGKDRSHSGAPPNRTQMAKELLESLDLDEIKGKSFLEIFNKYDEKAHALMEGDRKEGFEKMKALEEDKNEELKIILSESEYKKYLSVIEKMRPPKPPNRE
ncbi:hypothetical protein [Flagellimonas zhangzhouensis]|uniref:DUF4890 domain-containing protein n=1 Tax=Flagellimonas zhangzhouensis TaxID=1073328 RepID=A0A1H2UXI0_9FLAO|nr:hypothetical protein [Allomuricauda zhangzhouensis]SDQ12727.1 hypothetical protein SAMN05216294_0481 [Allomuricauda zhangzhouensis]SDW60793.1 hypothetical protein SAMN04487892_1811 [Allomuricauda zhangzhouensis]